MGLIGLCCNGSILYKNIKKLKREERQYIGSIESELKKVGEVEDDEHISGLFEESGLNDTMGELRFLLESRIEGEDKIVNVHLKELYDEVGGYINRYEVWIDKNDNPIAHMLSHTRYEV